jgi:hypothetical protein
MRRASPTIQRSDDAARWSRRLAGSALGPHGIRNRWSSLVTSGQRRRISSAGQRPFTASTLESGAARRWVRIPPPPQRPRDLGTPGAGVRVWAVPPPRPRPLDAAKMDPAVGPRPRPDYRWAFGDPQLRALRWVPRPARCRVGGPRRMTARLTIATALALGSLATLARAALAGYRWAGRQEGHWCGPLTGRSTGSRRRVRCGACNRPAGGRTTVPPRALPLPRGGTCSSGRVRSWR